MSATGWQAHSVRGLISGALGKRLRLNSDDSGLDVGPGFSWPSPSLSIVAAL